MTRSVRNAAGNYLIVIRRMSTSMDPPAHWMVKAYRERMRIGELARRAGVSDKTLRYYEEIGVLAQPQRTASGYRDYDEAALSRLRFVRTAQAVGLTLGEIREIVGFRDRGETPCAHVAGLIRQRAEDLDQRIAELQRMRADLRRLARRAQLLDPTDCEPDAVCHLIGTPRVGGARLR